eukprot:GILK01004170.1.p1 GENE.GILK01004170.1~~GILK01004170.1.p1  ORF type:complete len:534 (+),score=69.41 GILK01004170.1:88-1689(+)
MAEEHETIHVELDFRAGQLENLDENQRKALSELRSLVFEGVSEDQVARATKVGSGGDRDRMLCRFLRARQFNVKKAHDMLMACLEWRQRNEMDNILRFGPIPRDKLAPLRRTFPITCHGFDVFGRPVIIQRIGMIHLQDLKKGNISVQDVAFYHKLHMEYMLSVMLPLASARAGRFIDSFTVVTDMKAFGSHLVRKDMFALVKAISEIDQNNYPECLGKCFVVNAPWLFYAAWKVVKVWLDKRTIAKISIHKSGSQTRDTLLEFIPAHALPVDLGGSCTGCPTGCTLSDKNGWSTPDLEEMEDYLTQHNELNCMSEYVGAAASRHGSLAGLALSDGPGLTIETAVDSTADTPTPANAAVSPRNSPVAKAPLATTGVALNPEVAVCRDSNSEQPLTASPSSTAAIATFVAEPIYKPRKSSEQVLGSPTQAAAAAATRRLSSDRKRSSSGQIYHGEMAVDFLPMDTHSYGDVNFSPLRRFIVDPSGSREEVFVEEADYSPRSAHNGATIKSSSDSWYPSTDMDNAQSRSQEAIET